MNARSRGALVAFTFLGACGASRPHAAAPPPTAAQAPAAPPPAAEAEAPLVVASAPPEPIGATPVARPVAAPVTVAGPCEERRLQVSLTRATGDGSFILRLSCAGATFAISSDRARPDGQELTAVFKVPPLDWERAYRAIEDLRWRTYDDSCGTGERQVGQSAGPVFRVEIQDANDRRAFHCAGVRAFADTLDDIHARLLALAPASGGHMWAGNDRIGVQQCDDFLDRYQTCIEQRVPAAERPSFASALADTRLRLRDALVADPSAGPALVKTCQRLKDEARKGTARYGCKF